MCLVFHVSNKEFLTLSDHLVRDIETYFQEFSKDAAAWGAREVGKMLKTKQKSGLLWVSVSRHISILHSVGFGKSYTVVH